MMGLLSVPHPIQGISVRNAPVELFGSGIYRYDSLFAGAGNRGTDAVTLALDLPLLAACIIRSHSGLLRWRFMLTGALTWLVYVYATMAFGSALNPLFMLYVVVASASGWSLVYVARSIAARSEVGSIAENLPRRGPAALMLVSGAVTAIVWCIPVVLAQLSGRTPDRLDSYTTLVTVALDSAVIAPAAVVAGMLILRRQVLGYLMAVPLLILEALLAPAIAAQTVSQVTAGIDLTAGQIVGPVACFALLAGAATLVAYSVIRHIPSI